MQPRPIVSREYKLMLRSDRFAGDEDELLRAADTLWEDLRQSAREVVLDIDGGLKRIKRRRRVQFLDTSDQHLRRAQYILRRRNDLEEDGGDVTLKFRHSDRYIAQGAHVRPADPSKVDVKFEEDIKAPFASLYSLSHTVRGGHNSRVKQLSDVAQLFPDIRERLSAFPESAAIAAVNGFSARELVVGGAEVQIGKTPKVNAECALIVWYDDDRAREKPTAVELSYRYGDAREEYGGGSARRAFDLFDVVQKKLSRWVDTDSRTKTALVFG